ncbi:hypothetical protein ACS3UN_09955 [Oscillospiraceae bacterium LTW-04]|nr:hypothetical protein RBH76_11705 [Oscillospiraceae bacterium MB24-C1]
MKIKDVATLCKKNKIAILYESGADDSVEQYVGDGAAIYKLFGLPYLDTSNLLTIFDVPEKDRTKWLVNSRVLPEGINLSDCCEGEQLIDERGTYPEIVYAGRVLKPLEISNGIILIQTKYLKPVSDEQEMQELYERKTRDGLSYIVVKTGLIAQAAIMPMQMPGGKFADSLAALASQIRRSAERAKADKQAEQLAKMGLTINQDTGEVQEIQR